jgi:hypothetical protein
VEALLSWPIRLGLAALLVAAGLSASPQARAQAVAAAAPSNVQLTQAQLQAQYDALFQQMLRDPSNLDLMFQFAAVATRLENYEAAIGTLERMLLFNPNLPRVKLELGVLYFRLGSYVVARQYFEDALASADAPPVVRERVQVYLDEMDRRDSRHQVAGAVTFGARYQTNANAGPASSNVRALGFDATLDDEFMEQDDWNLFALGTVQHVYDLQENPGDSWITTALAYYSKQVDLEELDLGYVEATTGPRFTLIRAEDGDLTARPFGLANLVTLGDDLHFYTAGAGVDLLRPIGDDVLLSAGYIFRYKHFINTDERPNNDAMSAYEHTGRASVRMFPFEGVTVEGRAAYTDEDAHAPYESNTEWLAGGAVSLLYDAPFGLTERQWQVRFGGEYIETDFRTPDPLVDPMVTRFDREWRARVTNTVPVTDDLLGTVEVQYQDNQSNLPNFEYDNWSVLVSATKTY